MSVIFFFNKKNPTDLLETLLLMVAEKAERETKNFLTRCNEEQQVTGDDADNDDENDRKEVADDERDNFVGWPPPLCSRLQHVLLLATESHVFDHNFRERDSHLFGSSWTGNICN